MALACGLHLRSARMYLHGRSPSPADAASPSTVRCTLRTLTALTSRCSARCCLLTIAIRPPSNLPEFVRWSAPQVNLGEYLLTARFYGYEPFDGLYLPMGYTTKSDWRDEHLASGGSPAARWRSSLPIT